MSYIKETLKYLVKNFFPLAVIFVAPAVVLAFFVSPMASISFIPVYAQTPITSYYDLSKIIFNLDYLALVYPIFLIFFTLLVSFCMGTSMIEKHFRIGKLRLNKPFSHLNDSIVPGIIVLSFCTLILFLYSMILLSVTYLLHVMISGAGNTPNVVNIILITFLSLGIFILIVALAGPIVFVMPLMITYGYKFTDALTQAFSLVGKKYVRVVFGGVFPFVLVAVLQYILSFFEMHFALNIVLAFIFYLFITMYISIFVVTAMFDLANIERRDRVDRYKLPK